jgi:hypothetical protein
MNADEIDTVQRARQIIHAHHPALGAWRGPANINVHGLVNSIDSLLEVLNIVTPIEMLQELAVSGVLSEGTVARIQTVIDNASNP